MTHFLEELTLNAWPALQTILYDGWILRFADGYTRRANSVNLVGDSQLDFDTKIAHCEQVYTRRGQPTIFKLTGDARSERLDAVLSARGYTKEAPTSVQTFDIPAAYDLPAPDGIHIAGDLTESWIAAFCALNHVDEARVPTMRRLLANIVPETCFIALHHSGQTAAVGLGVLERGCLGIFDIVTAEHLRNRGLGQRLMLALLGWGRSQGAACAYLQVMLNNAPALHLYAKLGFREVYQYWYRVRALPQARS